MEDILTEYRKVQVLGRSSYAVTLPKSWVKDLGLHSGSVVVVTVDGKGMLHILPESLHKQKEAPPEKVLDAARLSTPGALAEAIKACYRIGYETIRVSHPGGTSPGVVAQIHDAAESLYGTIIISETPNETVLQSSIDVGTFTVRALISRMNSFFIYLTKEMGEALQKGSLEDPAAVAYRAREVDKVYSLLVRQLVQGVRSQQVASRVGLQDVIQCLGSRMVAKALRDMNRSMIMISRVVGDAAKGKKEHVQQVVGLISELQEIYKKAYEALQKEDIRKAAEVLQEQEPFRSKVARFERSLPKTGDEGATVSAMVSLVWELQNVTSSVAILAEIAVNRYVEKE